MSSHRSWKLTLKCDNNKKYDEINKIKKLNKSFLFYMEINNEIIGYIILKDIKRENELLKISSVTCWEKSTLKIIKENYNIYRNDIIFMEDLRTKRYKKSEPINFLEKEKAEKEKAEKEKMILEKAEKEKSEKEKMILEKSEKEKSEKEKIILEKSEKEKMILEKEKIFLEKEKMVLEKEKMVLENEKRIFEKEKMLY